MPGGVETCVADRLLLASEMGQLLCLVHPHRCCRGLSSSQFQELEEEAARRSKENTD